MFHFIPIYCQPINNHDDAIDIFRNIKNIYNINIGNQELYFIIKNKSKIIDNFFSYYDKSIPIIYIIDKNYYIRAITDIKNFHLSMIKNTKTKIEKNKYIEQVNNLIQIFEEQKSINDIYQTIDYFLEKQKYVNMIIIQEKYIKLKKYMRDYQVEYMEIQKWFLKFKKELKKIF